MAREMSASDLVVGWVDHFDHSKGFGFVSPLLTGTHPIIGSGGQVFIHASRCRLFAGTPEQPEITRDSATAEWVKQNVVPGRGHGGSRDLYSYVVMRVAAGDKGPRASAWAVIPRRQTIEDVLRFGGLGFYVGTEVAVVPVKHTAGDGLWGELDEWMLRPGKLLLALKSAHGPGVEPVRYGDRTEVIDFDYLRVTTDSPASRLTLRLTRTDDQPTLDVVCWHRPPLN